MLSASERLSRSRLAQASHPGWLIVAACGVFLFAAARAARPAAGRSAAGLGGRSPVPAGRTTVR